MKNLQGLLFYSIMCLVLAAGGVIWSIFKLNNQKPVILSPNTVTVYDSLKNVIAYKDKKRWILINEQGTVLTLEKEIYRLTEIANRMEMVNRKLKHQNDSLRTLKRLL
jgi:hypothetical protein